MTTTDALMMMMDSDRHIHAAYCELARDMVSVAIDDNRFLDGTWTLTQTRVFTLADAIKERMELIVDDIQTLDTTPEHIGQGEQNQIVAALACSARDDLDFNAMARHWLKAIDVDTKEEKQEEKPTLDPDTAREIMDNMEDDEENEKTHVPIDPGFPVQPVRPGQHAEDPATCGHCGLTWDDAIITEYTPAPSARCPFEAFHLYPDMDTDDQPDDGLSTMEREPLADMLRQIIDVLQDDEESPMTPLEENIRLVFHCNGLRIIPPRNTD